MSDSQQSGKGCLPWLLVLGLAIVFVIAFPAVKTESVYMRVYVYFYEARRLAAVQGDIQQAAQSLKSVVEYEPLKVSAEGDLGKALKIVRQGAIREIIARLRTLSGEDLGEEAAAWVKKYYREDTPRPNQQDGTNGSQPLRTETNQPSSAAASRRSP